MREQPNEEEQVRDERSQNQKRILNYTVQKTVWLLHVTHSYICPLCNQCLFLRFALFFLMLEVALVRAAYVEVVAHLDLSQGVQELVVAVGEHVQLVACVSLSLLLGLREAGLVSRCQFNVYLHILQMKKVTKIRNMGKKLLSCYTCNRPLWTHLKVPLNSWIWIEGRWNGFKM